MTIQYGYYLTRLLSGTGPYLYLRKEQHYHLKCLALVYRLDLRIKFIVLLLKLFDIFSLDVYSSLNSLLLSISF